MDKQIARAAAEAMVGKYKNDLTPDDEALVALLLKAGYIKPDPVNYLQVGALTRKTTGYIKGAHADAL